MLGLLKVFGALYFACFLMQTGVSSLMTYLALRLNAEGMSDFLSGTLMSAYAVGMIIGARVGQISVRHVGHIRTYVAFAGIGCAAVLMHILSHSFPLWLILRVIVGISVICQLIVLESWLNECSQNNQRGSVLALYMTATYLGSVLGQLFLSLNGSLSIEILIGIAIAFSLCLVPVAFTRCVHPEPPTLSPVQFRLFIHRLPQSLMTIFIAGMINASFYGLASIFAVHKGFNTSNIGLFMASVIGAGLLVQWPLGVLSDRFSRANLVRGGAVVLMILSVMISYLEHEPAQLFFIMVMVAGAMHFCFYPLAIALANDNIESDLRLSLAGMMLITYGVGSAIGPLLAGIVMDIFTSSSLYYCFAILALILAFYVGEKKISGDYLVDDAPLQHQATPNGLVGSTLAVVMEDNEATDEQTTEADNNPSTEDTHGADTPRTSKNESCS